MLQLKLVVGKGKVVSIEGVGLVRVDPRFLRSSYSRSGRCRREGTGEPETEFKKKNGGTWERLEPNFVWCGSERALHVGASLGRRRVKLPQASRRHWPRPRDKVRLNFLVGVLRLLLIGSQSVMHSSFIHFTFTEYNSRRAGREEIKTHNYFYATGETSGL